MISFIIYMVKMKTKKIFLYHIKRPKREAKEMAKKAIDVIGVFLHHGLVKTEFFSLLSRKKKLVSSLK